MDGTSLGYLKTQGKGQQVDAVIFEKRKKRGVGTVETVDMA